jgi:hypothetical protein
MSWIVRLISAFAQWLKSPPWVEFSVWIAGTPLSIPLNQNSWITPSAQSIHILSIAATFGAALMINLRIVQLAGHGRSLSQIEDRYAPWVWRGLGARPTTRFTLDRYEWGRCRRRPPSLARA